MNAKLISKRIAGSTELFVRKHGPSMLIAAGVGGFVASSYLTARAALKSQKPVEQFRLKTEEIRTRPLDENFTKKDQARELGKVWAEDGIGIMKIYAPSIAVGSVAIFCVVTSHGMMRNRNAAIAAAYAVLDTGFRTYRARVAEELGTQKELELYRGKPLAALPKEGEEPTQEMIEFRNQNRPSPYSRFFDESNVHWSHNPEYNMTFLRQTQDQCNDRLNAYGFIFLNEVYQYLGYDRTQAGQAVGWRRNTADHIYGDGYVDFGIYDAHDELARAFVNGHEPVLLLDFNVDGVIIGFDEDPRKPIS